MVKSNGSMSRKCGNFAATNDEPALSSPGVLGPKYESWPMDVAAGGEDIHDFTIEASVETVTASCERLLSSGKHTLGVNGVRRPISAAAIRDIGGDGHGAVEVFLTGGENLISMDDHSVSEICWRRGAGVTTREYAGGCHLIICIGERSRFGS